MRPLSDNRVYKDSDATGTPAVLRLCGCGATGEPDEFIVCLCGEANCFECWDHCHCNNQQCDRLSALYDRMDD